jgi:heme-degrading monooxygenase HmoA
MFAHSVTIRLKPNGLSEFNKIFENEILPLLRKQKGYRYKMKMVTPNGDVVGISMWDHKEDAEAYHRAAYPEVQKLLSTVSEGTPEIQTYEVPRSTFHKVATHTA